MVVMTGQHAVPEPDAAPEADPGREPDAGPGPDPGRPRPAQGPGGGQPLLPSRSSDETDVGWGDEPEPDDEDRLRRDRPPHWDSP